MANNEKTIYGYVEKTTFLQNNLTLSAKLDTGAKSSSLYALNIKKIEEGDKTYLTFIVPSKEGDVSFKCEYLGEVNIKVRNGEKKAIALTRKALKRPVVLMKARLANKEREIRVNLANRKHFIYPLLLGREAIISFDGLVDPSKKYNIIENKPNKK
jgi:hypothetical protein